MWDDVEAEDLEERRGHLEDADPGADAVRARGEDVDGFELRGAGARRGRRRRRPQRRGQPPGIRRHARLAQVRVCQRDPDRRRLGQRGQALHPVAPVAQRDNRPEGARARRRASASRRARRWASSGAACS